MTVTFNHTIVYATDKHRSAKFLATVLGLPKPQAIWSFMTVPLDHGVALDFATTDRPISLQHYAFLVSEEDFDGIFARIQAQGIPYWADPERISCYQICLMRSETLSRSAGCPAPALEYPPLQTSPMRPGPAPVESTKPGPPLPHHLHRHWFQTSPPAL